MAELTLATFAAGCFWGVQDAFDKTNGVIETAAGYMGGFVENPTYKQVCDGGTEHVEAVQVKYDPSQVTYEQLLEVFWKQVEQITLQLLDHPTRQYLPVIFYHDEQQEKLAKASQAHSSRGRRMAEETDVIPASQFWPELDQYHQHYCQKHGACH